MKKVILVGLMLALVCSVVPAMAETSSTAHVGAPVAFQAMSNLSTVMPMTDTQLAAVEGAAIDIGPINIGVQIAVNPQLNVCAGINLGCLQINFSFIAQQQWWR